MYTGAFQTQAVAWYMHLHEMESEIFAFPPGSTIAPSYSALSRDPRFPTIATTRKWVIGSSCARSRCRRTPPRPAWSLKARAITTAWVTIPAGLGALVALSLLLRTTELGIGFWIDEGLSVGIADRPLGDIPLALREDGSPPLYYMLLHFWLDIGGRSEAGVRGLSLLFALLAIPAASGPAAPSGGRAKAAWFAAILMAFNPFLAQYAQEARMYSLVALLAIPATTCFLKAYALDTDNRRPWIAGLRGLGGRRALHAQLADLLHRQRRAWRGPCCGGWRTAPRRKQLLRDGLLGFGGLVVLYLPWVPTTLYQAAHTGAPWADAPALQLAARRARRPARHGCRRSSC